MRAQVVGVYDAENVAGRYDPHVHVSCTWSDDSRQYTLRERVYVTDLQSPRSYVFFSSRRRHTRCSRDWSSDVCSSDLNRYGLIPWFCGCRGFGGSRRSLSRRARGDAANQEPIFALVFLRLAGILFIGGLHPIGYAAPHNFDRNISRELVKTRLGAARQYPEVGGHFRAPARLHRHVAHALEQLDATLPERRLHQLVRLDPADGAAGRSHLHVFIALAEDLDALPVM